MNEPRKEVKWFAEQMEKKLQKNDHRSGWKDADEDFLLQRLQEEILELKDEICESHIYNSKKVIEECADVANFAMMIADNADRFVKQGILSLASKHHLPSLCCTECRNGEKNQRLTIIAELPDKLFCDVCLGAYKESKMEMRG